MEATNFSINKQSSVSINVETLQAIKQRVWFMVKGSLLGKAAEPSEGCMVKGAWFMVLCLAKRQSRAKGAWSLPRLYRKELRLARAVARAIDAHPTLSNIFLWLMGIAIMIEVFLFA